MRTGKIKILHAIRQGLIGGGETHVLDLVKHLDKDKFESHVLSFTDGPMIERLKEMGIGTTVIHTTKPFDFRVWRPVKKLLSEGKFNLVHAHGTRAASNLLKPSKSLGIPIIYTVHGWSFHDDQQGLVKKLRIASEKYISDRTTLNISVSKSNQDTGIKYFGKYTSIVINNGIDLDKFNEKGSHRNVRTELGITPEKTVVCCTMRMTKQKDPMNMTKAFGKAVHQDDNLHLLMVGDGELKEDAMQLATSLGINGHITFEKFRSDVPDVLYSIDIYCLPSLWEGLPIGLLEAMGMGKAVIATNVDGSKEIVRNNENGILIEPQQTGELAASILRISGDPQLRRRLSENAILTVKENYNVEAMTRKIEDAYKNLLIA